MSLNPVLKKFADKLHAARKARLADPNLSPWKRKALEAEPIHESVEAVKRGKRRPSLAQHIRQVMKTGLTVAAVQPDGTLVVGKPGEAEPIDASDIDETALEARREWH